MQRAQFTVYDKNGVGWCANHLAIANQNGREPDEHGQVSVLTFICSGSIVTIPAASVDRVEFRPTGATYCSECDQSIWPIVGAGLHANPDPPMTRYTCNGSPKGCEGERFGGCVWCDSRKAASQTWTCGCGTVNGVNLAACRVCGRKEGEQR